MEPFLTTKQLAKRWNMESDTLKRWRWSGKGPGYHKIEGRILYLIEDIEKYEKEKRRLHTSMPTNSSLCLA